MAEGCWVGWCLKPERGKRQSTGRSGWSPGGEVFRVQRDGRMEIPPREERKRQTASPLEAGRVFHRVGWSESSPPPCCCLSHGAAPRQRGRLHPFHGRKKKKTQTFVKPRHWGFWLGTLWLIRDSMRSVLWRMPQRRRTDSAFSSS